MAENEAPERIWLGKHSTDKSWEWQGSWNPRPFNTEMIEECEYIRADVAAARIERLEQALREIGATAGSDNRCTLSHSWRARAALNDESEVSVK